MDVVKGTVEDIVAKKRSGVLLLRRSAFGDPLLTAYFYRGQLLHATSFVVKRMWWEGLLDDREVSFASDSGNLFRYAAERYGEAYLEHLMSHAKDVVRRTLELAKRNGWEVSPEVSPLGEYEVESMFGLDIVRSGKDLRRVRGTSGDTDTVRTTSHSTVLSLIERGDPSVPTEDRRDGKMPDAVLRARALGFFVLYVPGEDNRAFLTTLGKFSGTFRNEFQRFREALRTIRGTVVAIFPLFALVRLSEGEDEVWGITSDAKKVAYALMTTEEAGNVPRATLHSLATKYGTSFVWREGNTFAMLSACSDKRMSMEEFIEFCSGYFDRFRGLIDRALSLMPGDLPERMKKIHVLQLLRKCPTPDSFKREFYAKFGIKLE